MLVEKLETAAKLSDEYSLTHKHLSKVEYKKPSSPNAKRNFSNSQCNNSGKVSSGNSRELTCFHCGKKEHIKAACYKYLQGNKSQGKGVMLVRAREDEILEESVSDVRGPGHSEVHLEDFKWYVSSGSVKFPSCSKEVKVKILRDTASAQSLLLEKVLPKGIVVEGGESVLLDGFPNSVVTCPLMTVCLDSSLVKGPVKVAFAKSLPVKGIDFVLGNDLAQNKVGTDPVIVHKPETQKSCNFVDEVLPVNVVTRSKSREVSENQDLNISNLFDDNEGRAIPSKEGLSPKKTLGRKRMD